MALNVFSMNMKLWIGTELLYCCAILSVGVSLWTNSYLGTGFKL